MPVAILDRALGTVGIRGRQRRAHVLEADAVFVERLRTQLHTHRRQRAPAHGHLAHAGHLRELLRENRRRRVVHLSLRHRVRGQREDHDRRVGRIHLAVGRVAGQTARQQAARGIDRSLDVARGAVDVAAQVELQRDAR